MNSLALQRLKLFSQLNIEEVVSHWKEEGCTTSLKKDGIFMLDEAFSLSSTLSDIDENSLFYVSGYVAFKKSLALKDSTFFENSEFLLIL